MVYTGVEICILSHVPKVCKTHISSIRKSLVVSGALQSLSSKMSQGRQLCLKFTLFYFVHPVRNADVIFVLPQRVFPQILLPAVFTHRFGERSVTPVSFISVIFILASVLQIFYLVRSSLHIFVSVCCKTFRFWKVFMTLLLPCNRSS